MASCFSHFLIYVIWLLSLFSTNIFMVIVLSFPLWYVDFPNLSVELDWQLDLILLLKLLKGNHTFYSNIFFLSHLSPRELYFQLLAFLSSTVYRNLDAISIVILCHLDPHLYCPFLAVAFYQFLSLYCPFSSITPYILVALLPRLG